MKVKCLPNKTRQRLRKKKVQPLKGFDQEIARLSIYLFINFLSLFILKIILLFNYSCLYFFPAPLPHPSQTHLLPLLPPSPLVLSMCPLQQFLKTLLPAVPTPSPLATVRLFLISMTMVIFCLLFSFVDYVPVKGEIIWTGWGGVEGWGENADNCN